jgi:hypothetical protein
VTARGVADLHIVLPKLSIHAATASSP